MIRRIIHIDEEKCNGCGLCAEACHEGAIDIIDGKAKLMKVQLISLTERLNWSGRISATVSVTACRDVRPERLRSKSAKRRHMMRLQ